MAIRWQAHRYLLRQSVSFFQDEFAGRIATKVMLTAFAVRETVMRLLDIAVYILVYFTGMIILLSTLDYRLGVPRIAWFFAYSGLLYSFLPRLSQVVYLL